MADIFISYSRLDRERVKPLAERLTSLGYTVWWAPGERRQASVHERARAMEDARAVLAVWSANGRNAADVHADAAAALDAGKLVQLRLDAPAPPAPFDTLAVADMTGAGEWGPLEHAIAGLVRNGEGAEAPKRFGLGPAPTLAAAGAPKLAAFALAAVLAAFVGALAATLNGVMRLEQLDIALVGILGVAGACAGLSAHRLLSITRAAA